MAWARYERCTCLFAEGGAHKADAGLKEIKDIKTAGVDHITHAKYFLVSASALAGVSPYFSAMTAWTCRRCSV